jgi:alkanesulfonate monooxygenase SsuD/methylene tetrahydromethanopterin reductase-like flavin-dependent oxidoreductase (luciferase family)
MRIGMFTAVQWSPEENPAAFLKELREQVRAARDHGFASLLVGQHLLTGPVGMFQPHPLLGQLVEDAAGMQIGPGVLLLGMMNPVLAAEEAATLDWLSDGNYVLGAGLGYRPEEFQAMGVDQRKRVGRLTEGLEVIKRLWTEERVTHHGRHFRLDDVQASVRPKQRPRPPIWLGGSVEAAVRRAARIADAWCIAPTSSAKSIVAALEAFRDERRKTGQPDDIRCPLIRECFVGRDAAHARDASRGPLLFKYQAYASWGEGGSAKRDLSATFDDFARDRFLIGDIEQVKDGILRYADIAKTDHILLRTQWPGLEHREALGSIERMGSIIAALRQGPNHATTRV